MFLRARSPHWALTRGVSQVVFAAGERTGLGPVYAHRLLHSAATGMLRAGAPPAEIGQVLRHCRLLSTAICTRELSREEAVRELRAHHARQAPGQAVPPPARGPVPGFPAPRGAQRLGASAHSREEVLARICAPPFHPANGTGYRKHGTGRMLEWLETFQGRSWRERWQASGAESLAKEQWLRLPLRSRFETGRSVAPACRGSYQTGLLMLVCADVVRPAPPWMVRRAYCRIVPAMACQDPAGFAALQSLIDSDPGGITAGTARLALVRITMILACAGGLVRDITVGDYLDLIEAMRDTGTAGAGRPLAYRLLHELGHLGPGAPTTGRAFLQAGHRTIEELVDRRHLRCRPVRDLLAEYLRERQPAMDYTTLTKLAGDLVRLFWADLERHRPGIDSLQLAPDVTASWKERLATRAEKTTGPDGRTATALVPRANARSILVEVRAFYLDIAQWALEEPERWARWAVPCPVREAASNRAKEDKLVNARLDQRTRERLPPRPALARTVAEHRKAATAVLDAARQALPGTAFTVSGRTLIRLAAPTAYTSSIWVAEPGAPGQGRTDATDAAMAAELLALRHKPWPGPTR